MEQVEYLKQRLPLSWNVFRNGSDAIEFRDSLIEKGKGYRVTIQSSILSYDATIELENFAGGLNSYVDRQLADPKHPIRKLFEHNQNVSCKRYRCFEENAFSPVTSHHDKWWLVVSYRRNNAEKASEEKFADMLVSFLLSIFPYHTDAEEEGSPVGEYLTLYERSRVNRAICLAFYGYNCRACGINLKEQYGDVAHQFIHVHHVNMISQNGPTKPNPIEDMVPLCPNCHGIAHRRNPPYSVDEIRNMIIKNNGKLFA